MKVFVTGIREKHGVRDELRAALLRGARLALARMGKLAEAKDTAYAEAVLEGAYGGRMPQLIGETKHEDAARAAMQILSDAGWTVGSDPTLAPAEEDEFQVPLSTQEEESAEPIQRADEPSHLQDMIAHLMLASSDGSAGQAVIYTNSIRHLLRREGEEEHAEFWDAVLQSLFDAFPVNEDGGGDTKNLAASFGR